jgi:Ubiquitin-activating enzyme E1 FCCH domain
MGASVRYKWAGSTIAILTGFHADSPANAITAVTKANPAVVTDAGHNLVDGDVITISGVVGMTELNGGVYTVNVLTSSTFELLGVNSTGYGTWTSGGTYTIGTFSNWCELTSYNRSGGTSPEIAATSICSTAKEFELGLPDFGTTALAYHFAPQTPIQLAISAAYLAGSTVAVKVVLPKSGGTMVQQGFIQQTSEQAANDGMWSGTMTLRNTGNRADFT